MRRVTYAAKITGIEERRAADDPARHFYILRTDDPNMRKIHVLPGHLEGLEPEVGGYYLRYDDGAESYSPWKRHVDAAEKPEPEQADEGYRGAPPTEPGPLAFQALSLAHNPNEAPAAVLARARAYLAFLRDPDTAPPAEGRDYVVVPDGHHIVGSPFAPVTVPLAAKE